MSRYSCGVSEPQLGQTIESNYLYVEGVIGITDLPSLQGFHFLLHDIPCMTS